MTNHPLQPDPGYYTSYILKVPEGDIVQQLEKQGAEMRKLLSGAGEEKGNYAYADGKWTVKELAGHICDAERIFCYRALRFARNDATPLNSFDENEYVRQAFFNERTLSSIIEEYQTIRSATVVLFRNLNTEELNRTGTASKTVLSVIQLAYIIAGHELHHIGILKERYGF
jgi:hypothetical protein